MQEAKIKLQKQSLEIFFVVQFHLVLILLIFLFGFQVFPYLTLASCTRQAIAWGERVEGRAKYRSKNNCRVENSKET